MGQLIKNMYNKKNSDDDFGKYHNISKYSNLHSILNSNISSKAKTTQESSLKSSEKNSHISDSESIGSLNSLYKKNKVQSMVDAISNSETAEQQIDSFLGEWD